MTFGPPKINAGQLTKATPTAFDAATLRASLTTVGLNCGQLTDSYLRKAIDTVDASLDSGTTQTFGIKAPKADLEAYAGAPGPLASGILRLPASEAAGEAASTASMPPLVDAATGNWTPHGTAEGFGPFLEVIQYPAHFDWLYDNRASNGFTGVKDDPPMISKNEKNVVAIQNLFISAGTTASATVVNGLDKSSMKAVLSNVIQPLKNANLSNYSATASRVIFILENYNPGNGDADALGVVSLAWTLTITDYKRKTKDGGDTHPTTLKLKAHSVTYSSGETLCSHYNSVVSHFKLTGTPTCNPDG